MTYCTQECVEAYRTRQTDGCTCGGRADEVTGEPKPRYFNPEIQRLADALARAQNGTGELPALHINRLRPAE